MKKNNTPLVLLWSTAAITLLTGLLLTLYSAGQIGRTTEIWNKKAADIQELASMRALAAHYRDLLKLALHYPAAPVPLGELARTVAPGLHLITRTTERQPSVAGWTTQKVSLELANIPGDDLGRLLEAASTSKPPWALLDCTLSASPVAGRLSKVELVMVSPERQD